MKRYLWVVEFYEDGKWGAGLYATSNRNDARLYAMDWRGRGEKTRVRKYIPEDK